jgi:hypothetical protein
VSLPGPLNPIAAAAAFGGAPPNYPSIHRLWQGFVFMFGNFPGDVPQRLMILIIFTNRLWIPFIVWADVAVRGAAADREP